MEVPKKHERIQEQKLADAEHQRNEAMQLNNTLQGQNAALQETCQQTAVQLQQLHRSYQRQQSEVNDKSQRITGLQQQSINLEQQLNKAREQYSTCAQSRAILQRHCESARAEVKKLGHELEQSYGKIDHCRAVINKKKHRLEKLQYTHQQSLQTIRQLRARQAQVQHNISKLRQSLTVSTQQLKKTQALNADLLKQLEQKEAAIRHGTQAERELCAKLKQLEHVQQRREQQFRQNTCDYHNRLRNQETLVQEYRQQASELRTRLQRQMAKEQSSTGECSRLKSQLTAKAAEIEELQTQYELEKHNVETLQRQLSTLESELSAVQASASQTRVNNKSLQQKLETLNGNNQQLTQMLDEAQEQLLSIQEQALILKTRVAEEEEVNKQLEQQLAVAEQEKDQLNADVEKLRLEHQSEQDRLNKSCGILKQEKDQAIQQQTKVEREISGLRTQFDEQGTELQRVQREHEQFTCKLKQKTAKVIEMEQAQKRLNEQHQETVRNLKGVVSLLRQSLVDRHPTIISFLRT